MSDAEQPREDQSHKLLSKPGVVIDLALSLVFFLVFTFVVLPPHVPGHETNFLYLFSGATALCLTMVFWMALGLFRVTLVDHKQKDAAKEAKPEPGQS